MNVESPEDFPEKCPLDLQMGKTEGGNGNTVSKTATGFKEKVKYTASRAQTLQKYKVLQSQSTLPSI